MLKAIKKFLNKEDNMVMVVENDKPSFVIMTFEAYNKIIGNEAVGNNTEKIDEINADLTSLNKDDDEEDSEKAILAELLEDSENNDGIKIEDLPF